MPETSKGMNSGEEVGVVALTPAGEAVGLSKASLVGEGFIIRL